ncbi:aminodeoxychorismate synthase component I [Oceanobacter kriegii]|uniref:aminodeoxychorismate synthase component I n=1 Tax=Oceanobacter kriegii TaxID=64972 RepID=UPI0012EB725B|nr:aminodeoxychorismate synthase component I [Oceanobacter kriegii]
MPYFCQSLSFSAQALLFACHRLPAPALLYSGLSGHPREHAADQKRWAVLAFAPTQQRCVRSSIDWNALTADLGQQGFHTQLGLTAPHERFISGWMGYFSYDAGRFTVSGLPNSAITESDTSTTALPYAEFNRYAFSILLDLDSDQCELRAPQAMTESEVANITSQLQQALDASAHVAVEPTSWKPGWDDQRYEQAFDRVQEYINAGDVYQVNLTMPFHSQANLTERNPTELLQHFDAPFSCYFKSDALTLFSVSPERFVKLEEHRIVTSPIKGTAPRGATVEEDEANKQWLASSEKNQAENLMIVDLLRNDLGRSARPGSVSVDKLFDIESHANVHHMVSTISAEVQPTLTPLDAVLNAFPGGSITGAPKKRAMEVIQELEHSQRGLYCGSFGYFSDSGVADFNILIRSIVATEKGAECWGGGGVVKDSTAESEYEEIFNKVQRIMDAPL